MLHTNLNLAVWISGKPAELPLGREVNPVQDFASGTHGLNSVGNELCAEI